MRFVVVPFFVLVMSDEGEVDGEQQAEDECLHNTGEELDGEEEVSEVEPGDSVLSSQFVHGYDGFAASEDIPVEPQAQGDVFHHLRDEFDDEDHECDRDHREGEFGTGKVAEVSEDSVSAHAFVLDITHRDEGHAEVKTKV